MYVGIVRGSGKNDLKGAKEAFQKAVAGRPEGEARRGARDAGNEEDVRREVAGGGGAAGGDGRDRAAKPAPAARARQEAPKGEDEVGNMDCTPKVTRGRDAPSDSASRCTTTKKTSPRVELKYKEFGDDSWKSVKIRRHGDACQAEIPCSATSSWAPLRVYVRVQDATAKPSTPRAARAKPVEISSNADRRGGAGATRTRTRRRAAQRQRICPPDFPGCNEGRRRRPRAGAPAATRDDECQSGLACVNGSATRRQSCDVDADCAAAPNASSGKCRRRRRRRSERPVQEELDRLPRRLRPGHRRAAATSAPRTARTTTASPASSRARRGPVRAVNPQPGVPTASRPASRRRRPA